jgi:hypothetical protein
MDILSDDENLDSIEWLPHGQSFIIRNHYKLENSLLPCYFGKQATYQNFIKELCRWKFVRIPSGNDKGALYNEVSICWFVIHRRSSFALLTHDYFQFFYRESVSPHLMLRAQNGSTPRPKLPPTKQAFGQAFPSPDPKCAKMQFLPREQHIGDYLNREVASLLKPRQEKWPVKPCIAHLSTRYCQEIALSTKATTSQSSLQTSLTRNLKM